MKLIIDNSDEKKIFFYLKYGGRWLVEKITVSKKPLLEILGQTLKKRKKDFHDLSGIGVVVGKGRFTATRVAATVANALAYGLNIPVIALTEADTAMAEKLFKKAKKGVYISATYSAEPRISGEATGQQY